MAICKESLRKLKRHAELLYLLTGKELKVRYKNAALGFLWIILNPLLMMAVLTVVFSFVFRIGDVGYPYPLFLLCALIPWTFFNLSLSACASSIVDHHDLIKKVYFPRQIIPLSAILSHFVNFLLSLMVLFVILLLFGRNVPVTALALPAVVLVELVFVVGFGLLVAALNVTYRDVAYIVQFLLVVWFYATPIFYTKEMVSEALRRKVDNRVISVQSMKLLEWLYDLNPMTGIVESVRNVLLGGQLPDARSFLLACAVAVTMLLLGWAVFAAKERLMADYV